MKKLLAFALLLPAFAGDGEHVVVNGDLDVLALHVGQLGLDQELLFVFDDVDLGTPLCDRE
jgi:hypothetical protein